MCRQFTFIPEHVVRQIAAQIAAGAAADVDYTVQAFIGANALQSAYPGSSVPVIMQSATDVAETQILTWGFEVSWQKQLVFNTRIEKALEDSSMWRNAMVTGRCVIPVSSFYETHRTETVQSSKTGKPIKRRYAFSDPNQQVFFLAGVQENGRFSVVTTEPNNSVSPVHDRMPIALHASEIALWFGPDFMALADRSGLSLIAQPEQSATSADQLSLF